MFRREWRQQILVVALLTVAVAAAIGSITLVYNTSPEFDGEFGSASGLLMFDGSDPQALEAALASAEESFGTTDVIGHRKVPVPGGVETVDFRSQDPDGPYGGDLLALRSGSYPAGPGQVALTEGVAELLNVELGATLDLDGRRRTVVGIVENPLDLSDEFALVSPSSAGAPQNVTVLVDASQQELRAFADSLPGNGRSGLTGTGSRGEIEAADSFALFSVATVFLLLASLVAAAGFAVVAQRRLRQLGMLAAIGATQKHLRLVLLTNGAVVGVIAAILGTIAGGALWVIFAPTLESAMGHRIDRLSLPWTLLAMVVLLAILGATAAAWWPGRTVARLPTLLALSGRPPQPRPARHSAIAAAALITVGIGCLALSDRDRVPLIIAGIVATILGMLLLGPLAIRIFSGAAGHAPIGTRLALRDLARYQARSGAALAAITLALGIAAAVTVTAAAEEKKDDDRMAADLPNLSDRQIRVYTGPTQEPELIPLPLQTPAQLARSAARVRQIAAGLGQAAVIPLRKVIQPGERPIVTFEGDRALVAVGLSKQDSPEVLEPGIGSLRRHARPAQVPRDRPRHGRPERGLPGRPDRSHRRARHPGHRGEEATPRHERPEDRQPGGPRRWGGGHRPRAVLLRHPRRSSPPRLEAGPERLAHRVEQPSDERTDRHRTRARRRGRPRDRDTARAHLPRHAHRDRDRRRRPPRACDPRHDRRADPQRERR